MPKRKENALDWSVMLIGVRNSLAIQAVNNIPPLFSGSSRKLSRDEALKNWLHLYKHLRWLENVLSNPYKLSRFLPIFNVCHSVVSSANAFKVG